MKIINTVALVAMLAVTVGLLVNGNAAARDGSRPLLPERDNRGASTVLALSLELSPDFCSLPLADRDSCWKLKGMQKKLER